MARGLNLTGAAALLFIGTLPAAADVTSVTCSDFMALDAVSKKAVASDILNWFSLADGSSKMPNLIAKYASPSSDDAWTPDKFVLEIEGHCKDAVPSEGILQRLDEHS